MARPRKDPNGRRQYEVSKLWDKHHEVIRLIVLGFGNKEISEIVGVTPQNVSDVRNSEIPQRHIKVLQAARDSKCVDVSRALMEDAPKSLQLLMDVRDGEEAADIRLRASVAQDLLSRAGYGKVQKVQGAVVHGVVSEETLARVKARRAENAVEAEFEEAEPLETEAAG